MRHLPIARSFATRVDDLRVERDWLREQRDELREQRSSDRRRLDILATQVKQLAGQIEQAAFGGATAAANHPSFFREYLRMRRIHALAAEIGHKHPIWGWDSKLAGREIAEQLDLSVPDLLVGPTEPASLELPLEPHGLIVKPVNGASARGVAPLVKVATRRWLHVFEGTEMELHDVRSWLASAEARGRISGGFVVERLIAPPTGPRHLPCDWKFYCIDGRVQFVLQRDTQDSSQASNFRFRFWSPLWEDLGQVREGRWDSTLPEPRGPERLLRAAEKVASSLPGIFVRVDLYEDDRGPVFGEITPHPGGDQNFREDVDRRLGAAWEAAEARRIVHRGDLAPSVVDSSLSGAEPLPRAPHDRALTD